MDERLNGTFKDTEEEISMQNKFWENFKKFTKRRF